MSIQNLIETEQRTKLAISQLSGLTQEEFKAVHFAAQEMVSVIPSSAILFGLPFRAWTELVNLEARRRST